MQEENEIRTEQEEELAADLYLKKALENYREKHHITQTEAGKIIGKSQGEYSKILSTRNREGKKSKMTFALARKIAKGMNSTIAQILCEYDLDISNNIPETYSESDFQGNNISENDNLFPSIPRGKKYLLTNIDAPEFSIWYGTYHCYFYSTLSSETQCFDGVLEIPEESENGYCNVKFSFVFDKHTGERKEYIGFLVISSRSKGVYCVLADDNEEGEMTFLVMSKPELKNTVVCCVVAMVVTISGGKDRRHPCVERMLISREELNGPSFELAKTHLHLNDKFIRITESSFTDFLRSPGLPEKFKERFKGDEKHPFQNQSLSEYVNQVATIPTSWVKSMTNLSEREQQYTIDLMRQYSIAPKLNKINQRVSENDIFELYKDVYKKRPVKTDQSDEKENSDT